MNKNRIIFAVVVLAMGAAMWRMGAMEERMQVVLPDIYTFTTSDNERVPVEKDKAILFGTIKNMLQDAPEESEIPLRLVSSAVLNKIIGDVDYILAARRNMRADENEREAAKRIVSAMPKAAFDEEQLKITIKAL